MYSMIAEVEVKFVRDNPRCQLHTSALAYLYTNKFNWMYPRAWLLLRRKEEDNTTSYLLIDYRI